MDSDKGKVAIVTGAAGGIGMAIVRRLAAGGFTVLASDLREGPASDVAKDVGGIFQAADVTVEEQVAALVERAVADAAAQGRKVAPQCSYAARVFDDRPDWRLLRAS